MPGLSAADATQPRFQRSQDWNRTFNTAHVMPRYPGSGTKPTEGTKFLSFNDEYK